MIPVRAFDSICGKDSGGARGRRGFAVPLALPTFFEIPLALILSRQIRRAAGRCGGSPYCRSLQSTRRRSLRQIMRSTNWKVARLWVAVSIWTLAVGAGSSVTFL